MRRTVFILLLSIVLVACGDEPSDDETTLPPTAAETGNFDATVVALQSTNAALNATIESLQNSTSLDTTPTAIPSETSTSSPTPETPTNTPFPTETILPSAFPTPAIELVTVVEQIFEGGRMLWFRESRMVWVLNR